MQNLDRSKWLKDLNEIKNNKQLKYCTRKISNSCYSAIFFGDAADAVLLKT